MGREGSVKPPYEILAYITQVRDRVLAGNPLALYAKDEAEQIELTTDLAKALKADVVKLKSGDYMVIRV